MKSAAKNRAVSLARPLEEKRKLYKCKDKFIRLAQVQPWPEYYDEEKVYLEPSMIIKKKKHMFHINQ
jgi:hypothetical protein